MPLKILSAEGLSTRRMAWNKRNDATNNTQHREEMAKIVIHWCKERAINNLDGQKEGYNAKVEARRISLIHYLLTRRQDMLTRMRRKVNETQFSLFIIKQERAESTRSMAKESWTLKQGEMGH